MLTQEKLDQLDALIAVLVDIDQAEGFRGTTYYIPKGQEMGRWIDPEKLAANGTVYYQQLIARAEELLPQVLVDATGRGDYAMWRELEHRGFRVYHGGEDCAAVCLETINIAFDCMP